MDPLSLSASIAGLISLADPVFRAVFKYARAVKDARSDVQTLADEINGFITILRSLEALALDLESEGNTFDRTLSTHDLFEINKILAKVDQRVKKATDSFSRSKLEGVVRQLKWPFSVSETKELLNDLSRHKATITLALSADSIHTMQMSLSKTKLLATEVSKMAEVVRRVEINTQIAVEYKQERILDFFMKLSPQINLETSIKLRHPMTGLWLTDSPSFSYWLESPGSKLWLSGIPGAGKTVLAGSVIQEALTRSYTMDNVGVGFFFCDYKNDKTWNPVNILGAIASQLARQKNEAFAILQAYYDNLNPRGGLSKTPDSEELRAKIGEMSEVFVQTFIVVDGLDECGETTDDVVDILLELATYNPAITMALFSRDHDNIRYQLEEDFKHVSIAAHTEDIRLYVGAELENRIRTHRLRLTSVAIKDEILETLVQRADGMYVFQCPIISAPRDTNIDPSTGLDGLCVKSTTFANVLTIESDAKLYKSYPPTCRRVIGDYCIGSIAALWRFKAWFRSVYTS